MNCYTNSSVSLVQYLGRSSKWNELIVRTVPGPGSATQPHTVTAYYVAACATPAPGPGPGPAPAPGGWAKFQ